MGIPAPLQRKTSKLTSLRRTASAQKCRQKFLDYFPSGFDDETYLAWERDYKWTAHEQWNEQLNRHNYRRLLAGGKFRDLAATIVRIESRTNLLFSFEKMALRDAVKSEFGAHAFALGLYELLHGRGNTAKRFEQWCEVVRSLPRKQTRVFTWPVVTVFGFIAQPKEHIFLKPTVTRLAARAYGFDFHYKSGPNWETYAELLEFAESIRRENVDLHPRDLIDLQSFIWVLGSGEYPW